MFVTFSLRYFVLTVLCLGTTSCFNGTILSPEETVSRYLAAFQEGDFETAYSLVSKGMTRDQTKVDWVVEQQGLIQRAKAEILDFTVYPGVTRENSATVPNVLHAKDKLFNQTGALEYEVYELLYTEGGWKIDRQRLVIGKEAIAEVFPTEVAESVTE